MENIMIIAYHTVFTTYGTWLPNDPRGSFSKQIYNQKLAIIAPIKYGRQEDMPNKRNLKNFWTEASGQINRKPYFIDENARQVIANSFSKTIKGYNLIVPACAIMNDHIHMLILSTKYKIGFIINQLKGTATKNLNLKDIPWTEGYWKVFIYNEETLQSAIEYINSNPVSVGMPQQHWNFIRSNLS